MFFFNQKSFFFRGALTSKPYAFLARPWEFRSIDSIDVFDSLASNIRIDVRGDKILRILPRTNDSINEDWISDKIRFVCDAIRLQRIDEPVLRFKNLYFLLSWSQVFNFWSFIVSYLDLFFNKNLKQVGFGYKKSLNPSFILGSYLDLDASFVLNKLNSAFFFNLSSCSDLLRNRSLLNRSDFLLNSSLSELPSYDSIFLIDCNPNIDSPVLAIRFRLLAKSGVKFYSFGKSFSSVSSFILNLGSVFNFFELLKGRHWLSSRLSRSKAFFLVNERLYVNNPFLTRFNSLNFNFGIFSDNLSFLNSSESLVKSNNVKFENLVSSSNFLTNLSSSSVKDFFQSQGTLALASTKIGLLSHGSLVADSLDLLIPISSSFEQSKTYLNCLGLVQKTRLALTAPNNVLDCSDVLIFYYLFLLQDKLKSVDSLKVKSFFFKFFCFFNQLVLSSDRVWEYVNFFFRLVETSNNNLPFSSLVNYFYQIEFNFKNLKGVGSTKNLLGSLFVMPIKFFNSGLLNLRPIADLNFYQNDEISSISSTLGAASKRLIDKRSFK